MKSNAKSVSLVAVFMILARLLSFVSVQFYMAKFGATDVYINIYSYAISIPNVVFTCFGTALSTVFIPIFSGKIANGDEIGAKKFSNNMINITILISIIFVAFGCAISPVLARFTEFAQRRETLSFTIKALMIMMPAMIFYGLNYIFQGMLQSVEKYNMPALVSVPSSLIVIFYVVFLADYYGVFGLLIATLIGLSTQALILIPPLIRAGFRYELVFDIKDADIILAAKKALPVLLGVSAYQLNMFFNITLMANFENAVTMLYVVQNIVLYIVLALIYSITAVIYPNLTKFAAVGDFQSYKDTLNEVLQSVVVLMLPMSFGFISMRVPLLDFLVKYGKVTANDVSFGASLLALYSIGILGISFKEILDRALYSVKDTKTPAVTGVIVMLVNVSLSLVFITFMRERGIVLAYSVSALVGAYVLFRRLKRKIGQFTKNLKLTFFKCATASVFMFLAVTLINELLANLPDVFLYRLVKLFIPVLAGVIVYFVLCKVFHVREVDLIYEKIKGAIFRKK